MKRWVVALLLLLPPSSWCESYIDEDLDGVDDRIDRCLETPFEELVDQEGCSPSQRQPHITLQFGIQRTEDAVYDNQTLFDFYLATRFDAWDISLSTVAGETTNTALNVEDDLFFTLGYRFDFPTTSLRLFTGTAFILNDDDTVSRDNDYFVGADIAYAPNDTVIFRCYYSFTVAGKNAYTSFINYSTLILSVGYAFADNLYGDMSYQFTGAPTDESTSLQSAALYIRYMWDTTYYTALTYTYGLNDASYDRTLTLSIGALF